MIAGRPAATASISGMSVTSLSRPFAASERVGRAAPPPGGEQGPDQTSQPIENLDLQQPPLPMEQGILCRGAREAARSGGGKSLFLAENAWVNIKEEARRHGRAYGRAVVAGIGDV